MKRNLGDSRGRRSHERIDLEDLRRLGCIARQDLDAFFARHPRWAALYSDRVLCVALCQGAALHFVDGRNGVKDFDVYTFFARHSERDWCYRRRGTADFGHPKFGTSNDAPDFVGRQVDLIGRTLPVRRNADPRAAIASYLRTPRSATAKFLAAKAVVLIEPPALLGAVVWPPSAVRA